jgi:hypothetical protein
MHVSRRTAVALLAASALAGSATTAMSALGDEGGRGGDHRGDRNATLLQTTLAPSMPSDPSLHGVAAGAAPWVLRSGEAQLRRDGRLAVRIRGLVIPVAPANGTPGAVMTVSASLYCGDDTMAAGTTASFPISRSGNARIAGQLTLPVKCQVPALLVHPNGNTAAYIATSGFGG